MCSHTRQSKSHAANIALSQEDAQGAITGDNDSSVE